MLAAGGGGGSSTIVPCPPAITNCASCSLNTNTGITTCVNCNSGYYLDSYGVCVVCPVGCTTCIYKQNNNTVDCNSCAPTFIMTTTGQSRCVCPGDSYIYMLNLSCVRCPTRCSVCSSDTICSGCTSGYYLSGTSCPNCMPVCITCTTGTTCSVCVNNLVLVSGVCQCSAGTFLNPATMTCAACGSINTNCLSCSYDPVYTPSAPTAVICTSCNAGFVVQNGVCVSICFSLINGCNTCVTSPVAQCTLCLAGYYPNPSTYPTSACPTCPATCATCTSSTVCQTCISPFTRIGTMCLCATPNYLDSTNTLCVTCSVAITNCLTCTSTAPTTCATCATGYFPTSTNLQCLLCGQIITGCLTCVLSPQTTCSLCDSAYTLNSVTKLCMTNICGDGFITTGEACDDGNTNNGDGCSSTCTVEPYFTCNPSPTTGMSVCVLSQMTMEVTQLNKKSGANSA